jgi:hypothetical protein
MSPVGVVLVGAAGGVLVGADRAVGADPLGGRLVGVGPAGAVVVGIGPAAIDVAGDAKPPQ